MQARKGCWCKRASGYDSPGQVSETVEEMKRRQEARTIVRGGVTLIASSFPAARMLVTCLILQTLMSRFSAFDDSPMTWPT